MFLSYIISKVPILTVDVSLELDRALCYVKILYVFGTLFENFLIHLNLSSRHKTFLLYFSF